MVMSGLVHDGLLCWVDSSGDASADASGPADTVESVRCRLSSDPLAGAVLLAEIVTGLDDGSSTAFMRGCMGA
jgi:hypothetical protein